MTSDFTRSQRARLRAWWCGILTAVGGIVPGAIMIDSPARAQDRPPINNAVPSAPLVRPQDLTYGGAFRLPQGSSDENTFEYGGTALAYHAAHDSLWLVGHDWYQRVAEIGIPRVTNSTTLSMLARAPIRQPWTDVLAGQIGRVGSGTAKVGGLLVWDETLIVSAYLYYDADNSQVLSHFRTSLDVARSQDLRGPYRVGTAGAGVVSGYMTPVPPEWQGALGGPALTGQCCLSIISRTSFGPAASVFAPTDVGGVTNPVPATPLLGYPQEHHTLGGCDARNTTFNCSTRMAGVIFPAGTRSVLFFGRHGLGPYCYGTGGRTGGDCVDPTDTAKGVHAYPYVYQVWAYDVLDLIAVKSGAKQTWEISPYQTWTLDLPFASEGRELGGVTYDPKTRRVFVSAAYGDGEKPLIHVLNLYVPPTPYAPFGTIDTPLDGATNVTGSLAVTGWALDDREVTRVRLVRDAVSPETPGTQVFIGYAVSVPGARPDIAAAHPAWPLNDRAGWGYLLLTNMLPKGGNGTFTLRAYADDVDGHSTLLGARTIVCTNASAIKPFGAIDTPAQGETVSGTYLNFGWALTPLPKLIPTDGSTITVYVDGVPVGRPSYNHYRSDIAGLFPGFNNSAGAAGVLSVDTRAFPNGTHTMAWSVTDSSGKSEGIGSRYFGIQNAADASAGQTAPMTLNASGRTAGDQSPRSAHVATLRVSDTPVSAQRGYSDAAPVQLLAADKAGTRQIGGKVLERFVLYLDAGRAIDDSFAGYLQVGDRLEPLPIGSWLHPTEGAFYWQPGIGFIGRYNLVFVRTSGNGSQTRVPVSVVLGS